MTPQLIALTCAASLVLAVPSWAREIGPEGLESLPVVDVVVLGEDVGVNGGVFRATLGLREAFGYALLWDAHSIRSLIPHLFDGKLPERWRLDSE